jgi:predicted Zn finger-like uncharacterized protein
MPIRARCPSCQSEYTLVDSLRGKHVRCQHCHQPFQAVALKDGRTSETAPTTELPPFQLTPPTTSGLPRIVLNPGDHPVEDVPALPAPPRQPRTSSGGSGAGKVGFPLGIVFVAVMAIRACVSLSSSSSRNSSRWETPSPQPQKLPFRIVNEKDIVRVPQEPNGEKIPENVPPWLPTKKKDMAAAPGARK